MRNFREYVSDRDAIEGFKTVNGEPQRGDSAEDQAAKDLLYKAARIMIEKNPATIMSFLDANGDEEIRTLIDHAKQKRRGMNNEKGLGNLGGDDLERVKTPSADKAGNPDGSESGRDEQ